MIFFTDRDLGNIFPDILRQAGLQVEKHADHFEQNAPDSVWLPEVARRGWFPITKNSDIHYKPNERDAAMRAGAGLLIVIGRRDIKNSPRTLLLRSVKLNIS